MSYKFGDVKPAESSSFIQPGYYRMKPTDVKLGVLTNDKKSKYLGVTFETEQDGDYVEKFFLSEGALPRLQYIHTAYFNKLLDKEFKNDKELETYFKKALTTKPLSRIMLLGGNVNDGNVYAQFPFSDFIVPKDKEDDVELGAFEEDGEDWKRFVKKSASKKAAATEGKKNGKIDKDSTDDAETENVDDADSDMPW